MQEKAIVEVSELVKAGFKNRRLALALIKFNWTKIDKKLAPLSEAVDLKNKELLVIVKSSVVGQHLLLNEEKLLKKINSLFGEIETVKKIRFKTGVIEKELFEVPEDLRAIQATKKVDKALEADGLAKATRDREDKEVLEKQTVGGQGVDAKNLDTKNLEENRTPEEWTTYLKELQKLQTKDLLERGYRKCLKCGTPYGENENSLGLCPVCLNDLNQELENSGLIRLMGNPQLRIEELRAGLEKVYQDIGPGAKVNEIFYPQLINHISEKALNKLERRARDELKKTNENEAKDYLAKYFVIEANYKNSRGSETLSNGDIQSKVERFLIFLKERLY